MNVENRLKRLEEALAPPAKLVVEIVGDGSDVVLIRNGKVIKRTGMEENES